MASVAEQNNNFLEEIKQEILNYYESLNESKKEIFNMHMIEYGAGVDNYELFLFDNFEEIKIIIKKLVKITRESPASNREILSYLLGYKKIVWLQGKQAVGLLMYFKKIKESINTNTIITKLDPNSALTDVQLEDNEYIIYDKLYEPAALKMIEIINNSNRNKKIIRNEAALGLLLGYLPERVIKWTCIYDERIRTNFWKQLCNGSQISDLLTFFDTLFNNKPITSGILADINLPTVTKFKNALEIELEKKYKKNKKSKQKRISKLNVQKGGYNSKQKYFVLKTQYLRLCANCNEN